MKVFKDIITGDEMFTDTYKYQIVDDAYYMVIGKQVTVRTDDVKLEGSNPSAEEAEEGLESSAASGIDVIMYMRLQETAFGAKKDYMMYMKSYLKSLKEKLQETKPELVEKLPGIQKPLTEILKNFKDLQFYTGESVNADGMVAILDYKEVDGTERPVLYFPIHGLEEEKL